VTLPIKPPEAVGLRPEAPSIAAASPEGLLLRPAGTLPVEIYTKVRVRQFDAAEADLAKILPKKRGR
jgi:antitoxin PrlF